MCLTLEHEESAEAPNFNMRQTTLEEMQTSPCEEQPTNEPALPQMPNSTKHTSVNTTDEPAASENASKKPLFKLEVRNREQGQEIPSEPAPPPSSPAPAHSDETTYRLQPNDAKGTKDIQNYINRVGTDALGVLSGDTITPRDGPDERSVSKVLSMTKGSELEGGSSENDATAPKTPDGSETDSPSPSVKEEVVVSSPEIVRTASYVGQEDSEDKQLRVIEEMAPALVEAVGATISEDQEEKNDTQPSVIEEAAPATSESVEAIVSDLLAGDTSTHDTVTKTAPSSPRIAKNGRRSTRGRPMNGIEESGSTTPLAQNAQSAVSASTNDLEAPGQEITEDTQRTNDSQVTDEIKVMFSQAVDTGTRRVKKAFELGATQVDKVVDCDIFCVKEGPLTRSANLVLAIAMGKPIVSDKWISACIQAESLIYYGPHLASDAKFENRTGFKIAEAIKRGKDGCKPLEGYEVLVTPTKKSNLGKTAFLDLGRISKQAGATGVASLTRRRLKVPAEKRGDQKYLAIFDSNDPDLELAMEKDWRCYKSDVITVSVLRGLLDENSEEFLIEKLLRAKRAASRSSSRGGSKKRKTI